jgi:N-acetylneuraminate synthase
MNAHSVFIIAEAGVNHNGNKDMAFALIDAAAHAGADAVKFQTFNAERLASKYAPKAAYQKRDTEASESQLTMLKKLELPREWHLELKTYCEKKGVQFLSTAFDSDSLQFLLNLDMPLFKVPSGELVNSPLLWQFARTLKPLILSTGMATLSEVELGLAVVCHALNAQNEPAGMDDVWRTWGNIECRNKLRDHVTLLHCTSQYPTPSDEVNLRAMDTLFSAFGLSVGYSDHTEGIVVPIAAAARGAKVIEKHFTLDRSLPGPDHKASLVPHELKRMVDGIRVLQVALGDGYKAPQPSEWDTRQAARQQVVAARDIGAGAKLSRADITTARCGRGVPASGLWDLVGRSAVRSYRAGEIIDL